MKIEPRGQRHRIQRTAMSIKERARRRVIDGFEQNTPDLAISDRKILERLRNSERFIDALQHLEDASHLDRIFEIVALVLEIARFATSLKDQINRLAAQIDEQRNVRAAIETIMNYCAAHPELHVLLTEPFSTKSFLLRLLKDLSRLNGRLNCDGKPWEQLDVTHKYRVATAPRITFMVKMAEDMLYRFGNPSFNTVAALTDVVFESGETTAADDVRRACNLHGQMPSYPFLGAEGQIAAAERYKPKRRKYKPKGRKVARLGEEPQDGAAQKTKPKPRKR